MTQKQLSKYSGVSESMICAIETEQRNPTVIILCQLAMALHVDVKELFEYHQ
jgi:transcriptional regulator with XRE-family HTH domain